MTRKEIDFRGQARGKKAQAILVWFMPYWLVSKKYIIRLKWTLVAQVIPFERYLARDMQLSYMSPFHLEKNSSSSLVHTTPHHLDDIWTNFHIKYVRYSS